MELVKQIWALCEPVIEELGMELVEVEHVRAPGGAVLRLYIDRDGGVSVGDCAGVSREVGFLLDAEDVMKGHYYLEVSSPGIDRVLRKREHFQKFKGRPLRVVTRQPVEGSRKVSGRIYECSGETLYVETDKEQIVEIPLSSIEKANLRGEIPFRSGATKKKRGKLR